MSSNLSPPESEPSAAGWLSVLVGVAACLSLWINWLVVPGILSSGSPAGNWILGHQTWAIYLLLLVAPVLAAVFLIWEGRASATVGLLGRWVRTVVVTALGGLIVQVLVFVLSLVPMLFFWKDWIAGPAQKTGDVVGIGDLSWVGGTFVLVVPLAILVLAAFAIGFRRRAGLTLSWLGMARVAVAGSLVVLLPWWVISGRMKRVNSTDEHGFTALMLSAIQGQVIAASNLVAAGADVNQRISEGQWYGWDAFTFTLLGERYDNERAQIAQILIEHGLHLNARDSAGRTRLMLAVMNHNPRSVLALVKAGADVTLQDHDGMTALMLAYWQYDDRDSDTIKVADILEKADPNRPNRDAVLLGQELLTAAGTAAEYDKTLYLIQQGADVNLRAPGGDSALIRAVIHSNYAVIPALIKAGAQVDHEDTTGRTAMMYAVHDRKLKAVQLLIDGKSDVNHRGMRGQTPLIEAAILNQVEIAQTLLRAGADVNATDSQGKTALYRARFGESNGGPPLPDREEMVSLLTKSGARP